MISDLADRPRRKYEPVAYEWIHPILELQSKFEFLEDYTYVYLSQDCETKGVYNLDLGLPLAQNHKCITLNKAQREALEFELLSTQDVTVQEDSYDVIYVPFKKNRMEGGDKYRKLKDHKHNVVDDQELMYGPIIVTKGKHKGRIGYYDDDAWNSCIVYFGDFLLLKHYYIIRRHSLSNIIPTMSILERHEYLIRKLFNASGIAQTYELLAELCFCDNLLFERYIRTMNSEHGSSQKVFISLSSSDIAFARALATDLSEAGFDYFLYEWSIELGENIPEKISEGLDTSIALILLISKSFLTSVYCRDEWTSYYLRFAKNRPNSIYPIILDDSEPPALLSAKKYFRIDQADNYNDCLDALFRALKKQTNIPQIDK